MWRERVGFGSGDQEDSTAPETGASVMPIGPYLSKQAFGPEVTHAMGIAFDAVCRALAIGNSGVVHPRIVARKIIELAQMGERDPERLRDLALETFRFRSPHPPTGRPASGADPKSLH
jgi:hypothetical protein